MAEKTFEEAMRDYIAEHIKPGTKLVYELSNEAHHGQAAINIMNGLPPEADPSEVEGRFNDWLQPLFPGNVG